MLLAHVTTYADPPQRRIVRTSLPRRVAEELLADVERGTIRPGEKLAPELTIAQQFGVSRGVVREALNSLQALGIIEVVNGVGAVVRSLSAAPLEEYFSFATRLKEVSIIELLEVRRGLEIESAQLAAVRSDTADIDEIRRLVNAMGETLADPAAFRDFDSAFHVAVARASKNPLLFHLVEAMRAPLRRSISQGLDLWMKIDAVDNVWQSHARILEAIECRDPDAAAEAMERHFVQTIEIIIQLDEVGGMRVEASSETTEQTTAGSPLEQVPN